MTTTETYQLEFVNLRDNSVVDGETFDRCVIMISGDNCTIRNCYLNSCDIIDGLGKPISVFPEKTAMTAAVEIRRLLASQVYLAGGKYYRKFVDEPKS